jgi:hypothetical protein
VRQVGCITCCSSVFRHSMGAIIRDFLQWLRKCFPNGPQWAALSHTCKRIKISNTGWSKSLCAPDDYLLTYSMEQSPSWESNRFVASQEIPRILWKLKVNYRIHKCLLPVSILSQLNPHSTTWRSILLLYPIYTWVSPVVSFLQVSPPNPYTRLSPPQFALHAPPISFFFILSLAQ